MSVAQPTEQNGHILGTVVLSRMRSSCALARAGARLSPRPTIPPSAVPAPAPPAYRKNSRRESSIPLLVGPNGKFVRNTSEPQSCPGPQLRGLEATPQFGNIDIVPRVCGGV